MKKPQPQLSMMSREELIEADRALYRRQGTAKTVIGYESDGRVVSKGGAYHSDDVMVTREQIREQLKKGGKLNA